MGKARRVVVLDTGYESFEYEDKLLTSNGYRFDIWPGESSDVEGKIRFAAGADGLFIRWTEIDTRVLEGLPDLRAIVRYGVGFENIDVDAATRAGVKVCNVQNYGNHAVSDHALALMYATIPMILMPTGVRVWGLGAVLFLVLSVLVFYAGRGRSND